MKTGTPCPLETQVAQALDGAGIAYTTPAQRRDPTGLDFRIEGGIEIEVKRMPSPRIAAQMATAENVIALQGPVSVKFFVELLKLVAAGKELNNELTKLIPKDWPDAPLPDQQLANGGACS